VLRSKVNIEPLNFFVCLKFQRYRHYSFPLILKVKDEVVKIARFAYIKRLINRSIKVLMKNVQKLLESRKKLFSE
jgi:hypothetical protein